MNSITIFFLLFVSFIFAEKIINIGGTTCIPNDLDGEVNTECTPVEGSTRTTIVGGVAVANDNTCEAGTADTTGITATFTLETDGFFSLSILGYGEDSDQAVLVFAGDIDAEDGCGAAVTVGADGAWSGFLEAGDYNVVVTSNDGAADACGEFAVTLVQTAYELTGTTDTWAGVANDFGFGCTWTAPRWAALLTVTPDVSGFYSGFGQGRSEGEDSGFLGATFVIATADMAGNLSSEGEVCNTTDAHVAFNLTGLGYWMEAGTEYTIGVIDADTDTEISVFFTWNIVDSSTPEYVCDTLYADQTDFLRPDVAGLSVSTECTEGTTERLFDIRHMENGAEQQFIVVDTLNCGDTDQGPDFDQAIVIYYDHVGTERDGDTVATPPADVCENFIIAGDSGDGGAVFYWFPAEAPFTAVPTTYGSTSVESVYNLVWSSYDIVGCIPENPYLPSEPTDEDNAVLAFVSTIFFFFALL